MPEANMARPAGPEELAAILREAAERNQRVRLGGNFSKDAYGGPLAQDALLVSTAGMRSVRQYEPRDLTISVEAGMPWSELTAVLATHNQMVPLDPPGADAASVGGVVAANLAGPRRRLYGTARDSIIGMSFVLMDGRTVDAGGMVVKNVAGLDFQKLLIGSYGTLAAITSVNFRVHPRPPGSRTLVYTSDAPGPALAERERLQESPLQPAAVDLLNPLAAARCGREGYTLLVRAQGPETVLARYAAELSGYEAVGGGEELALWKAVEDFTPDFLGSVPRGAMLRVSTALTRIGAYVETAASVVARAASGVLYLHFDDAAEAARWAGESDPREGACVVEAASPDVKEKLEMWPAPGDDFPVMARIKALFDPQNLLNPGRLHGRI